MVGEIGEVKLCGSMSSFEDAEKVSSLDFQ